MEKKRLIMKNLKIFLKAINLSRVINYYGLIEQTGSIFLECEKCGFFHQANSLI